VWVSGARGLLGTEVCRQLVEAGHDVVEADLNSDPPVDLLDAAAVAESLRGCDAIVHCAAIPRPGTIDPAELVRINTLSTFNALEEAWKQGVRTAVLASTVSIYGMAFAPEELPQPVVPIDEDTPLRYVDPYGLSKDFLERTGAMFARRGMTVTALRFHWIGDPDEVAEHFSGPPVGGRRNLWGYVNRPDAARACVLALHPHECAERYHVLLIAAEDTGMHTPTAQLLDEFLPDTERRGPVEGTAGLFDCRRAADVIGWRAHSTWREL
jgi:nucleoside-diphosphate-sugar epimerase